MAEIGNVISDLSVGFKVSVQSQLLPSNEANESK
ncbi:hypothetical protein XELAEV_180071291mg, partial [Xenopus laevis]